MDFSKRNRPPGANRNAGLFDKKWQMRIRAGFVLRGGSLPRAA